MSDDRSTFETTRARLEDIVGQVRRKDVSLEQSLDLLEEAVRLVNQCNDLIDQTSWRSEAAAAAEGEPEAAAPAEEPEAAAVDVVPVDAADEAVEAGEADDAEALEVLEVDIVEVAVVLEETPEGDQEG